MDIVLTTGRIEPLSRIRAALGGATDRIPVEKDLLRLVEEALARPVGLDPMDRGFLKGLTGRKVPQLADPWDVAHALYGALCLTGGARCAYEAESGLCTATAELEDLFLQRHIARGMPALAMEELVPPLGNKSFVVVEPAAMEKLHRSLTLVTAVHPAEGSSLVQWRITRTALHQVLEEARVQGLALLIYQP